MSNTKELEEFELTAGEKASPVWIRLTTYLQAELDLARARNDSPKLSEHDTATLRGDIKRLKALIALNEDRPLTE